MKIRKKQNSPVSSLWWFVSGSLELDYKLFRYAPLSLGGKIRFLFLKYRLLAKHLFLGFDFGNSKTRLFGVNLFYDTRFGIAGLQRILSSHSHIIGLERPFDAQVVVDVGANVGYFSIFAALSFPKSTIYSCEPVPQTFSVLERNLGDRPNFRLFNIGFTDSPGEKQMSFVPDFSSVSTVCKDGPVRVKMDTLDGWMKSVQIENIDLLKIDTEGHEMEVLKAGTETLSRTRYLFIEITLDGTQHYTFSEIGACLIGAGYNFQLIGFRNFDGVSEGRMKAMDVFFKNILHPMNILKSHEAGG